MLTERSVGVADRLADALRVEPGKAANEQLLKVFELLNELLRSLVVSIRVMHREVCHEVVERYVLLIKHPLTAEEVCDLGSVEESIAVFQVEAERWRLACVNEMSGNQTG